MCIINENKIDVQPSEQLKVYKSVVHGVGIIIWEYTGQWISKLFFKNNRGKKQFLRIIYPLIIIGEEQKYKHDDTNLSPHAI